MTRISESCLAVLLGMLVFANAADAEILPSFSLDYASWQATEIAIVDEGDAIDGRLTVIESLQGNLKKGEVIVAPKLKKFADKSWRTTGRSLFQGIFKPWNNPDGKPIVMTGRRMIVFLQHPPKGMTADQLKHNDHITVDGRANQLWIPAGFGGMETSSVWIEKGKAYSFVQMLNPGPSMLSEMRLDEKKTLARIRKLVATQKDLNRIEKMKDKSAAAKQAVAYLGDLFLRERIFEVLSHCGRGSLPTLLQILADPKKIEFHANAVRVLAIIDGRDVDEKLTELLKKEIALWQKLGPTLKRGWYHGNGLDSDAVQLHREQFSRTLAYVGAFHKRPLKQVRKPLDRFRRFWRSLPQLNEDPTGLNLMSKACDSVIQAIDDNADR